MWKHLIATLNGWKRIAPDLRGMGLSEVPEDGYAISEYADDMIALLDTLQLEQAVVCGLSMGGYVALDLIRRYPDRVGALILINTRSGADDDLTREGREEMISVIEREGTEGLSDLMIGRLLGESSLAAMPRVVDHLGTMICRTPTAGALGALRAMRDRRDAADILGGIQVPTGGRRDERSLDSAANRPHSRRPNPGRAVHADSRSRSLDTAGTTHRAQSRGARISGSAILKRRSAAPGLTRRAPRRIPRACLRWTGCGASSRTWVHTSRKIPRS